MTKRQAVFIIAINAVLSLIISLVVVLTLGRPPAPPPSPTALAVASPVPPTATATPVAGQPTVYVVQPGDTLSTIAEQFDVTVEALMQVNDLANPDTLFVGQELVIPRGTVAPRPTPTPSATLRASPTPAPGQMIIYVVKPGDNLTSIAQQFDVPVEDILRANGLANADAIFVGQELLIPVGGLPTETPTPPPTPTPVFSPTPRATATPTRQPVTPTAGHTHTPAPPTPTPVPPMPTPEKPQVSIQEIIAPGNVLEEVVVITNEGRGVSIAGWTLSNGRGKVYTFPNDAFLYGNGSSVIVHSGQGIDTITDRYWGADEAVWAEGDLATLKDKAGNIIDTYPL